MPKLPRKSSLALLFIGSLFLTTACSGADSADEAANPGGLKIVASTAIWGDVAAAVVDQAAVEVTAIVEGNDADPHSFEPSAQDMARAMDADIVIVGGGGYDAWLYEAVDQDKVVHALPLSSHEHEDDGHDDEADAHPADDTHTGPDHAGADLAGIESNEHIWYDTAAVSQLAGDIATRITELDPAAEADAAALQKDLEGLHQRIAALPKVRVAQTEPTADYILAHSNISEVTPAGYRASTLGHSEPAAADLAAFLKLIEEGELDLLIDNPQTSTDLTGRIRQAAEEAGIPVVEIFETPAAGEDYLDFFHGAIDRLEAGAADLPAARS